MSWIKIRQVVLGVADIEATSKELRTALGLAPGFADPILEDIGLADETLPVGSDAYLELVAALRPDVSIAQWIAKGGGDGGYALSIQVPSLAPHLAACSEAGIRVVADMEVYGHRIVQLHPGDMGLLIELDEIEDDSAWFWDDIPRETAPDPLVDDVLAVEVTSRDAAAQAELWSKVFGVPVEDSSIRLGSRQVRFVTGERKYLSAVDLQLAEGKTADPFTIAGVRVNLS